MWIMQSSSLSHCQVGTRGRAGSCSEGGGGGRGSGGHRPLALPRRPFSSHRKAAASWHHRVPHGAACARRYGTCAQQWHEGALKPHTAEVPILSISISRVLIASRIKADEPWHPFSACLYCLCNVQHIQFMVYGKIVSTPVGCMSQICVCSCNVCDAVVSFWGRTRLACRVKLMSGQWMSCIRFCRSLSKRPTS